MEISLFRIKIIRYRASWTEIYVINRFSAHDLFEMVIRHFCPIVYRCKITTVFNCPHNGGTATWAV
jgi:hypothetical protein